MKRALVWGLGGIAVMTLGAIALLWASSAPQPVAAPSAPETTAAAPAPAFPPPPGLAVPSAPAGADAQASVLPGAQPAPAPDRPAAGTSVLSPEEMARRDAQRRTRLEAHRAHREAVVKQREERNRKRAADLARRPPDPNRPAVDRTPLKLGPPVVYPETAGR